MIHVLSYRSYYRQYLPLYDLSAQLLNVVLNVYVFRLSRKKKFSFDTDTLSNYARYFLRSFTDTFRTSAGLFHLIIEHILSLTGLNNETTMSNIGVLRFQLSVEKY